jgi:hypothetical protein
MAYPKSPKGQDPPQKGNYCSNQVGAGNGIRTRDTKLGKLVLYQLSYARLKNNIIMKTGDNVNLYFFWGFSRKKKSFHRSLLFE